MGLPQNCWKGWLLFVVVTVLFPYADFELQVASLDRCGCLSGEVCRLLSTICCCS
jgi:hypothetical protein